MVSESPVTESAVGISNRNKKTINKMYALSLDTARFSKCLGIDRPGSAGKNQVEEAKIINASPSVKCFR